MSNIIQSFRHRPLVISFALALLLALTISSLARPGNRNQKQRQRSKVSQNVDNFLFAPHPPARIGPLVELLDTDRDGRLSPWEIEWAAESLRTLDRDQDGWINPGELPPPPPRPVFDGRHPAPPPPHLW